MYLVPVDGGTFFDAVAHALNHTHRHKWMQEVMHSLQPALSIPRLYDYAGKSMTADLLRALYACSIVFPEEIPNAPVQLTLLSAAFLAKGNGNVEAIYATIIEGCYKLADALSVLNLWLPVEIVHVNGETTQLPTSTQLKIYITYSQGKYMPLCGGRQLRHDCIFENLSPEELKKAFTMTNPPPPPSYPCTLTNLPFTPRDEIHRGKESTIHAACYQGGCEYVVKVYASAAKGRNEARMLTMTRDVAGVPALVVAGYCEESKYYNIMERVPGENLLTLMQVDPELACSGLLSIIRSTLKIYTQVLAAGVLLGPLCPAHIMVEMMPGGVWVVGLVDFKDGEEISKWRSQRALRNLSQPTFDELRAEACSQLLERILDSDVDPECKSAAYEILSE